MQVCFLAWTPSLGAVGLPSSILIFLILTFHLLTWCYMRHTSGMAKRLAAHTAATLTHTDQITNVPAETVVHNVAISSSTPINNELSVCVLDQSRDSYMPLIGKIMIWKDVYLNAAVLTEWLIRGFDSKLILLISRVKSILILDS